MVQQRKLIEGSEGDETHRRSLGMHLDAMLALCETVDCRRVRLLAYFGQTGTPCGNCDTCLTPAESWDATVASQKLLSTVWRLANERRQKFGAGQIIDILQGKKTAKVIQFDHDALSVFGIGADLSTAEWRGVVRQLLAQRLLAVEGEYGTLVLTPDSGEVLGGRRSVPMRKEKAPTGPARKESGSRSGKGARVPVDLPAAAEPVFLALRAWRAETAKEQGVPAYVVFHDATLREIATRLPATAEELGTIGGVGEAKLAKYAEGVLDTLAECGAAASPPAESEGAAPTPPAARPAPSAPAHAEAPAHAQAPARAEASAHAQAPDPDEPPFDLDEMPPPPWDDWQ